MTTSINQVNAPQLLEAYARAAEAPELATALRDLSISFSIEHADNCSAPVRFGPLASATQLDPTIRIVFTSSDFAQQFWAGQAPMAPALIDGELTIHGPINRILELVGVLPLVFAALAA